MKYAAFGFLLAMITACFWVMWYVIVDQYGMWAEFKADLKRQRLSRTEVVVGPGASTCADGSWPDERQAIEYFGSTASLGKELGLDGGDMVAGESPARLACLLNAHETEPPSITSTPKMRSPQRGDHP